MNPRTAQQELFLFKFKEEMKGVLDALLSDYKQKLAEDTADNLKALKVLKKMSQCSFISLYEIFSKEDELEPEDIMDAICDHLIGVGLQQENPAHLLIQHTIQLGHNVLLLTSQDVLSWKKPPLYDEYLAIQTDTTSYESEEAWMEAQRKLQQKQLELYSSEVGLDISYWDPAVEEYPPAQG